MYNIFAALALLSLAGLVIGLIRPAWLRTPSRLHVMAIFSTAALAFFFLFAVTSPSSIMPSQSPNTGLTIVESTKSEAIFSSAPKAPTTPNTANKTSDFNTLNADDRRLAFTLALANELIAQNNLPILRSWAVAHNIKVADFESATTLREEIRRASHDFAFYKDKANFETLYAAVLEAGGGSKILDKVLTRFE
ncbi:hypothetical protein EBR66_00460 [bacterium]|nr:hypothetical protein [bacterium]